MELGYTVLFVAVFAVVLYMWLGVRLSALAQPLRMEMVDICEELLATGKLTDHDQRFLDVVMDSTFSRMVAWRIVLIYPFALLWRGKGSQAASRRDMVLSSSEKKKLTRFMFLGMFSTLSTSPLASSLFVIEIVMSALVVAPTGRLIKRTFQHILDGENNNHPHKMA